MKTTLWAGMFWLMTLAMAPAQTPTNDLTALLQQGLLEEQANQNLDAAITDYKALATQFDKDRKVAATAVFRIGECYRMQGRTNEAAAQYGRVLRDFPDQKMLVNLSQENLKGMGVGLGQRMVGELNRISPAETTSAMSAEASSLAEQIDGIEKLSSDPVEQGRAVQAIFPDENLKAMLLRLPSLQKQMDRLAANPSLTRQELVKIQNGESVATSGNADGGWQPWFSNGGAILETNLLPAAQAEMDKQISLIEGRVSFILENQKARLKVLEAVTGQAATIAASFGGPAANDEEDKEIRRIQELIQNSPDLINAANLLSGHTELSAAAAAGRFKVVAYLLDHGADINNSGHGYSALRAATEAGNRAMVEFLLAHGADVNAKGNLGETALSTATRKKYWAVTQVLLAHKAEVNTVEQQGFTPLFRAVGYGDAKTIQALLAAGANPNITARNWPTPLDTAIQNDQVEIIQMLLASGADANQEDYAGRTPLTYAAQANDPKLVKLLLDAKADPNSGKLDSPLLAAIFTNNLVTAEMLLESGADPNAQTAVDAQINELINEGQTTPLILAIQKGKFPMVQLLLKYKADAGLPQHGWAPLFNALSHTNMLEALLDAGAKVDPISPNDEQATPLAGAVEQNKVSAAAILLKHGANPNARGWQGNALLHLAAEQLASPQMFELLLVNGANPNVRNQSGETPLDILKEKMKPHYVPRMPAHVFGERLADPKQLADLLRQHGARDKLPDWNSIAVSRAIGFSTPIFYTGTNDWNHFTLLETIMAFYEPGREYQVPQDNNSVRICGADDAMPFPDLAHIVIVRPNRDTTNDTRIKVNVLNGTNGFDLSKDMPLKFGDVVEIPELDHPLGARNAGLTASTAGISDRLKGTVHLTAGGQTVEIKLDPMPMRSTLGTVLDGNEARGILLSSSDLSRVKVTRRDPKTGRKQEWTVDRSTPAARGIIQNSAQLTYNWTPNHNTDGSAWSSEVDLWLQNGDVIEVPEKP